MYIHVLLKHLSAQRQRQEYHCLSAPHLRLFSTDVHAVGCDGHGRRCSLKVIDKPYAARKYTLFMRKVADGEKPLSNTVVQHRAQP
jgi:hypothetical protein